MFTSFVCFSKSVWRLLCPQERLRQQIEEIKEQEAAYDPNAALAMAMFEHSEVGRVQLPGTQGDNPTRPQCHADHSLVRAQRGENY